jgi:hypothetical protein
MPNASSVTSSEKSGIFDTEPYHLEKYVVPGAVAVAMLFLLPWYLLGGKSPLENSDLATIIIGSLVLGHIIEAIGLYQWSTRVKANFRKVNAQTGGLLLGLGLEQHKLPSSPFESVMRPMFQRISAGDQSEFAWNLVRWQKMIVIAMILRLAAAQWIIFAILAYLNGRGWNPFNLTWKIVILKPEWEPYGSLFSMLVLVAVLWFSGSSIYKYGLKRQDKTNEFFFGLIRRHGQAMVEFLKRSE